MTSEESIFDIIPKRESKRNYLDKEFTHEELMEIKNILKKYTTGPFGNKISFDIVEKKFAVENHKVKLGTYGFISGAKYFIVSHTAKNEYIYEDTGFLSEKIILDLTALDLATCWMGGTFKRSDFSKVLDIEEESVIPAVTPVGFPTPSKSIKDKIIRRIAKSDKRKDWSEIFFDETFEKPLLKENASKFSKVLEMLRLSPSASNKQPWRILRSSNAFHFYLKRTPGYQKSFINSDLQKIDMGIAMSHFEISCKELKISGKWEIDNPNIESEKVDEYIVSWKTGN